MTEKHQTPEWRKTVRIIRSQVKQAWARGETVTCWRHGHVILEGQAYDVGHITLWGGNGIDNAAPECRRGNRSHGGKIGARITNTRRAARTTGLITAPWAIVLALTACAPAQVATPEPTPTADPLETAMTLCIDAHPPTDEYADPDGEGQIQQTAAEACARWLVNVGEPEFIDQWDEEYADTYRKAFGS